MLILYEDETDMIKINHWTEDNDYQPWKTDWRQTKNQITNR